MGATLHPQLVAALEQSAALKAALGDPGSDMQRARADFMRARQWWNEGGAKLEVDFDATIPVAPSREMAVAVYAAKSSEVPRPAYVFLHGGGFRLGAPRANDRQFRDMAQAWDGVIVSLDYAHLPEAVFPTAVEETAAAYSWLHRNGGQWGIDGDRLAFGGCSAGANIAMGAAVQLGGTRSGFLRAGAFVVGVFDTDLETASMLEHGNGTMIPSRESAAAVFRAYAGQPGQRQDPRLETRRSDLSAMPPLFLAAAEVDVYRESSVLLAEAVRSVGGRAESHVYPAMSHMYWGYSKMVETAETTTNDVAAFLRRQFP